VLTQLIGSWEVPERSLRLVVAVAPQDGGAGMLISIFVSPLPDTPNHVHNSEWAGAFGMSVDVSGRLHQSTMIGEGHCLRVRLVPPELGSSIRTLCGVLPFPFVRQPLSSPPPCVCSRILE